MQSPTRTEWKVPAAWFALFNLLAAPVLGRVIWFVMLQFNNEDLRLVSIVASLVGAVGILAVNVYLTLWARHAHVPGTGLLIMWLVTGVTFLFTIGFGVFSPINLVLGFLRHGAGG